MDLQQKTKTALDETRILVLGSQVLIGFQFRSVFQDGYERLPAQASLLNGLAIVLMSTACALLIAPSLYHRTIAGGEDSEEIHRLISFMSACALLPFALSLGIDMFIGVERVAGLWSGAVAGVGFAAFALFWWYAWEFMRRASVGAKERHMADRRYSGPEETPLRSKVEQMLTEARLILPGVQALLGFQLAIVVTRSFDSLPESARAIHAISLGLIAVAVVLLMAPAAYHRIVYAGEDTAEFHQTGSILVTAATVPLALGLAADIFVVVTRIAKSNAVGAAVSFFVLSIFIALWYVYPWLRRRQINRPIARAGAADRARGAPIGGTSGRR